MDGHDARTEAHTHAHEQQGHPMGEQRRGLASMSGWTTVSWVLAFASVFFGLLTAIAGAICGYVGMTKGDPRARSAVIANVLVGLVSLVFAIFLVA